MEDDTFNTATHELDALQIHRGWLDFHWGQLAAFGPQSPQAAAFRQKYGAVYKHIVDRSEDLLLALYPELVGNGPTPPEIELPTAPVIQDLMKQRRARA